MCISVVSFSSKKKIVEYIDEMIPEDSVLILPTASSLAPLRTAKLEDINNIRANSSKLLCISPMSDTPQLTLPLVWTEDDVPFGLSIIGKYNTDANLVRLGMSLLRKDG